MAGLTFTRRDFFFLDCVCFCAWSCFKVGTLFVLQTSSSTDESRGNGEFSIYKQFILKAARSHVAAHCGTHKLFIVPIVALNVCFMHFLVYSWTCISSWENLKFLQHLAELWWKHCRGRRSCSRVKYFHGQCRRVTGVQMLAQCRKRLLCWLVLNLPYFHYLILHPVPLLCWSCLLCISPLSVNSVSLAFTAASHRKCLNPENSYCSEYKIRESYKT